MEELLIELSKYITVRGLEKIAVDKYLFTLMYKDRDEDVTGPSPEWFVLMEMVNEARYEIESDNYDEGVWLINAEKALLPEVVEKALSEICDFYEPDSNLPSVKYKGGGEFVFKFDKREVEIQRYYSTFEPQLLNIIEELSPGSDDPWTLDIEGEFYTLSGYNSINWIEITVT